MQINGRDIESGKMERLLLDYNETFDIEELPMVEGGTGLRRFRLSQGGKNCGHIYEDDIAPEVLAKL